MTYKPALFMPDVLQAAGCLVQTHSGWRHNGRPESVGSFDPRGIMLHHDASGSGPTPSMEKFIGDTGRPAEGIPAPLAQCWVSQGVWHILAAGRANHGGFGDGWGRIPKDCANTYMIGVEWDHTTGEKVSSEDYDALVLGFAALAEYMHIRLSRSVCGHKEYAPGRKTDPDISMDRFRADVHDKRTELRHGHPSPDRPVIDISTFLRAQEANEEAGWGKVIKRALVAEVGRHGTINLSSYRLGSGYQATVEAFEAKRGNKVTGRLGAKELAYLGRLHGFDVRD